MYIMCAAFSSPKMKMEFCWRTVYMQAQMLVVLYKKKNRYSNSGMVADHDGAFPLAVKWMHFKVAKEEATRLKVQNLRSEKERKKESRS